MNIADQNFGLLGQREQDYDYFLCLGKKCRRRRDKRRRIRNEKKRLKNDQRRADVERTRAETGLIKQTFGPQTATKPKERSPELKTGIVRRVNLRQVKAPSLPSTGKLSPWLVFGGVVLIGGLVLVKAKNIRKT